MKNITPFIPVINQTKSGFAPHRIAFNLQLSNEALARQKFSETEPASNNGFTAVINSLACKIELSNICDELMLIEECQALRLAAITDEIKKLLMVLEDFNHEHNKIKL